MFRSVYSICVDYKKGHTQKICTYIRMQMELYTYMILTTYLLSITKKQDEDYQTMKQGLMLIIHLNLLLLLLLKICYIYEVRFPNMWDWAFIDIDSVNIRINTSMDFRTIITKWVIPPILLSAPINFTLPALSLKI